MELGLRKTLWIMAGAVPILPTVAPAAASAMAHHGNARPSPVRLVGDVFVERFEPAPGGRTARVLERADSFRSGDRLVFVVSWSGGERGGFTVTNPVPRTVTFEPGSDPGEDVSVDGGHSWGTLDSLLVRDSGGWRPAQPGDVTHVRWRVPSGAGRVTYRGVVR
jgi:hypothetical protein